MATTKDITVTVRPVYLDSETDFFEKRFVFGYYVKISNDGCEPVRLVRRHWRICDETGHVEEVDGSGVIGKQPLIDPGKEHTYSSYSVLKTFTGAMEGYYTMEGMDGGRFKVAIPRFDLRAMAN